MDWKRKKEARKERENRAVKEEGIKINTWLERKEVNDGLLKEGKGSEKENWRKEEEERKMATWGKQVVRKEVSKKER